MKANQAMRLLLHKQGIDINAAPETHTSPIWKKQDPSGRPYWGTGEFWRVDEHLSADQDLSQLEWDGNELHLDAYAKSSVAPMLRRGIGIMKAWKTQLAQEYPKTGFLLLASFDDGQEHINKDDFPDGFFSLTLRFWAVRDGDTVVELRDFDTWEQPAFLDTCGREAT